MQDLYLKSVYRFLLVFLSAYVTRLIDRKLERDDWCRNYRYLCEEAKRRKERPVQQQN